MDKKLYNIGIWAYPVLIVLAFIFYKERIVLLDNAFFLFDILRTDTFIIHHDRYIAILTELFPVIAANMSLPLKWVVMSYSFGFIIWYFVFYVICGYVLKNYKLGLVLLLLSVLFATHTFYWGISELPLGMACMLPVWALAIDRDRKIAPYLLYPMLITGVFIAGLSHPLIVFPFFFVSAFVFLSSDIKKGKFVLIAVNILFVLSIILKKQVLVDQYEGDSMQVLTNIKSLFPDYFHLYANKRFILNWLSIYYWIPGVGILIIATYINQRKWLKMLLVGSFFIGYTLLINICFPDNYTPEFYIENMYLPLSIFLAMPLVYDVLPQLHKRKLAMPLMVLIIITGLVRIYAQHDFYTNRLDWFRNYTEQYGDEKSIAAFNTVPKDTVIFSWATQYEFWLLSTLENDKTASLMIHDRIEEIAWAWNTRNEFVTIWGLFPYAELNPIYFKFTDSTTKYKIYRER